MTPALRRYLAQLTFRAAVFLISLFVYLRDKQSIRTGMTRPVAFGISPIHILWLVFMALMVLHIFPSDILTMARRKAEAKPYQMVKNYSELELLRFVQKQNVKAWTVMTVWLSLNAVIGILYLAHILDEVDLFMLVVFFFLCDYICILFFCPFQTCIMGNRCCVNCRIYDWGHFMMFTPMLFIRSFFSWSLFFTSVIVLIHWEILYAKHPERFWSGSNQTLQCAHCQDQTCQLKKRIARGVKPHALRHDG